jgi:phenylacetate-CoA ligase
MVQDRTSGYFQPLFETMAAEQRADYQARRLQEILIHAWEHAPAVQARLREAHVHPREVRSLPDLAAIPILKKSDLIAAQRTNLPFGGFCALRREELRRIYVSPGPIYEPADAATIDERWPQALYAGGFRPGDVAQITFNFSMVPVGFWLDKALERLGCVTVPTGVGNTELQIQVMKELEVTAYLGTPSFLATIAERADKMGLDARRDLKLEVGFVAAEPLPESLRTQLEEHFAMHIRQSYGTADVGCLGFECMAKSGMHFPDDCIVELLDPQTGSPVPPGKAGEVVATVFDRSYPLIRFATGDLALHTEAPCPCGRTSPRLLRILGRVDQMTKVRGLFVHPAQVDEVAGKFPVLGSCQLVVEREAHQDRMLFRAEVVGEVGDVADLRRQVATMVQEILRLKGEVELLPRGSIAADVKKIDDRRTWE